MDWLWGSLVGFGIGAAVGPLVEPWSRRLQRIGRRVARENPVDVYVERDPSIIWAGLPPWMSSSHFFRDRLPHELPPDDVRGWSGWADRNGGLDLGHTVLRVTIVARTDSTVVLDTPLVGQTLREVPRGVGVFRPAPGGPSLEPRRYEISLATGDAWPWVSYLDEGGMSSGAPAPSWRLSAGDVEQLHIWAHADDDRLHEWTLDLPVIVDGRKVLVSANADGPFLTVGENQPHQHLWRPSGDWLSWRPREDPPEV